MARDRPEDGAPLANHVVAAVCVGRQRDLVTRRDVERLFGVSRVLAAQLMRTFGAELAGSSRVLRRADLLRQLKKMRRRAAFRIETERRTRVVAELRQARITGIRVAVPVEALETRLAGLPEGVRVEADRIEVRFAGAQEALVKLVALAQVLNNDYECFEELVGKGGAVGMSEALVPAPLGPRGSRTADRNRRRRFAAVRDGLGEALVRGRR